MATAEMIVINGREMSAEKHCWKCGKDKPRTNDFFYRNKSQKDGLQLQCKECSKQLLKEDHDTGTPPENIVMFGDNVKIILGNDILATIDAIDLETVSRYRWRVFKTQSGKQYVKSMLSGEDGNHIIQLHRLIIGAREGELVDHINGNVLDNRRCNLRICDPKGNSQNSRKRSGCSSQYKGVTKRGKKWEAKIRVDGVLSSLGIFEDEADAARAYNRIAKQAFGEFAYLNDV